MRLRLSESILLLLCQNSPSDRRTDGLSSRPAGPTLYSTPCGGALLISAPQQDAMKLLI